VAAAGALGAWSRPGAVAAQANSSLGQNGSSVAAEKVGSHPNFLVLMVDEMRYPTVYESQELAAFRTQYLVTQNALRDTGVELDRHYAASVACAPSRTSLWTGQYPSLHGVSQTDGAAKGPSEPDMFWLDPSTVPTLGDYLRGGGYHTVWKGKWHVAHSDLLLPGTQEQYDSFDQYGNPSPSAEAAYLAADRLDPFGFEGWIGPEPHGRNPHNTGSSWKVQYGADGQPLGPPGRDVGIADQAIDALSVLSQSPATPWLLVASFVNPHDIATFGFAINLASKFGLEFEYDVDDTVPFRLWNDLFGQTQRDDLSTKPSAQKAARDSYRQWMQPVVDRLHYQRVYYQLHKEVDEQMHRVYDALQNSPAYRDTIVIFTSDHGDYLGSHGDMHQKWYTAYDESTRVPFIVSNPDLWPTPSNVHDTPTSHIDVIPTMLALAGLDAEHIRQELAKTHSQALPLVGRDLSGLLLGQTDPLSVRDPIYFMTDDDMSRGLDQENWIGIAYDSVPQPNHIETAIARLDDGHIWKFSRYFDNPQFWSEPGMPGQPGVEDVVLVPDVIPNPVAPEQTVPYTRTRKVTPVEPDEFELYDVTVDPMELTNLAGNPSYASQQAEMTTRLNQLRTEKRLTPQGSSEPPIPPTPGPTPTTTVPAATPGDAPAASPVVAEPEFTG
jgi:choline-sulfatase